MPDGFKAEFAADRSIALHSDEIQVPLGTVAGFRMFVLKLRENGNVPAPEDFNREKYPIGKTTPGIPEWGTTGRCVL